MSSEEPTEQGVEITNYVGPDEAGQAASVSPTHKADALQTPNAGYGSLHPTKPLVQPEGNAGLAANLISIGIGCIVANIFLSFNLICFDVCSPRQWWLLPVIAMLAVIGLGANIYVMVKNSIPPNPMNALAIGILILVSILMNLLFLGVAIVALTS